MSEKRNINVKISREKYWQVQAGRLASIANWALIELLQRVPANSNESDQANEHLDFVIPFLPFDDREEG